ncbi:MAG: hypothetical protein MJ074_03865 [Oscillospiraceae bacterium]|nr:hypothetical protein [Oscillospiraceae bacterium]
MALTDKKITEYDVSSKGIQGAPDKLTGTAAENKLLFDRLISEAVREKFNALIDELVTELAGKMAAPQTDGAAGQYLMTDGAGGRSWSSPAGSGDMQKSVYDSDNDGRVDEAETALVCSGNAATAARLQTARSISIQDNAITPHGGFPAAFDGSGNISLRLPSTIAAAFIGTLTGSVTGNVTGNVNGNANTATRLAAPFRIALSDGSHAGASRNVDGGGDVTLPLPDTIRADLECGRIVLDENSCGDTLPAPGTPGRLFFLRVSG